MNIMENIRLAWEGLRANKMRALLTMLGIIIGIASVIGILTVGNGLSDTVTDTMGSLGASNIMVSLQEREDEYLVNTMMGGEIEEENLITEEMIEALEERFPYLNFPHQHGVLNLENSIFQPIKKA